MVYWEVNKIVNIGKGHSSMEGIWVLLAITVLGIVSKNSTVWISSTILLVIGLLAIKWTPAQSLLQWFQLKGIHWGVIILTVGVLSTILDRSNMKTC